MVKSMDKKYIKKGNIWELTETTITEYSKADIETQIEMLEKAEIKYEAKIATAEKQKTTYENQKTGITQRINVLKALTK